MLTEIEIRLLKAAPRLNLHRWSEHPEIDGVIDGLYAEIEALRRGKGRRITEAKKIKNHLKVCVLDLWAARTLSTNPYRSYSRNKTSYLAKKKRGRYEKGFVTYGFLIPVIDDLIDLHYVEPAPIFLDTNLGLNRVWK